MNNLLDLGNLLSMVSGDDIAKLGEKVGLSGDKAKSALGSSIPLIMGALAEKAKQPEEAENITKAIEKDHDGSILNNLGDFFSKGDTSEGDSILKHVVGDKKDNIAQFVSKDSGIDLGSASKLLSMAAPLVMGFLGKTNKETPGSMGITDILGSFMGGGNASQNIVSKLLDRDNDGSVVDDVMDMGKGMLGKLF